MKKYTILWHIFELESRAHDYLTSYVKRIDNYANLHDITPDILEDIKYNIIEKLYIAPTPITEGFVINISLILGEPEAIFENRTENKNLESTPKNLLERWLGKDKPMIRGVGYWLSKSLKIPVSIVRLILLWAVFIYGTSIWLYPLLALFVPFQDKKATTGQTGNMFFEIIRVVIWLGIVFFLASALFGSLVWITLFSLLQSVSNQSLQSLVPSFMIPLVILSITSLVVLVVGSIWALIKKSRVSKTLVIIASAIIIGSIVTAGITWLSMVSVYDANELIVDRQTISTGEIDENILIVNLHNDGYKTTKNYFPDLLWSFFWSMGIIDSMTQNIRLLPSNDNQVKVEIVDTANVAPRFNTETILWKRSAVTATISGNILDIIIPNNIFSQKVPFSFANRVVNIYVPKDKKIMYNNNSKLRYSTPGSWIENKDGKEFRMYCTDKLSFLYNISSDLWRCADTTFSEVNKNTNYLPNSTGDIPDQYDEETIERMFEGLAITQAYDLAWSKGRALRVVERDGVELAVTDDYRPGRINVETRNGLIIDVEIE